MIAIDTNVLVRLFVNDETLQAQRARALFDANADMDESLESGAYIEQAVTLYSKGPAGFADCLLAVKTSVAGCDALRSCGKKMRGPPGVKLL